jgi:serine/threonine protein kinase
MTDRVGQQLGNYRLVRLLGRGGFAEVYLGDHLHLGTQAAIKVLHTQVSEQDQEQFRREARTIARLEHPNIVRVLDFGIEADTAFLVMQYASNGSLRQRYPRGTPLSLATVLSLARQVASALQYAHDEKVIHRDVKPENMLVGRANEALLSDFGIALIVESSRVSKQDVIGTVTYMAPEQIRGRPCPASDQYALAVVIYEWLCGGPPFHGSFTEVATQHLVVPPPPLREKVPALAPAVEEVVMKALAKEPEQRFADVKTFASALEQASEPTRLRQVVPGLPLESALTAATPTKHPFPDSTISFPDAAEIAHLEGTRNLPLKPEAGKLAISRRTLVTGLAGLAIVGASGAGAWLAYAHVSAPRSHPHPTGRPRPTPTPLPLGTLLFAYNGHSAPVSALAWSPDGMHIASGSFDGTAQVWNALSGNHVYTYHGHSIAVFNVAWSPDSTRIASASPDRTVQVWDAFTGNLLYTYRHSAIMDSVAWAPRGNRIASTSDDGTAQVWDATTGDHLIIYRGHLATYHLHMITWSPDSTHVASGGDDTTVQIWNAASGNHIYTYNGHAKWVWDVAWSPNGKWIASASADGTVQVWDARNGNAISTFHGHVGQVHTAAWSPDSTYIASGGDDATVQIWEAASGNHIYTYRGHTHRVWRVAWSPRGIRLASCSDDATVQVWVAGR